MMLRALRDAGADPEATKTDVKGLHIAKIHEKPDPKAGAKGGLIGKDTRFPVSSLVKPKHFKRMVWRPTI
jgi:hypothetical protein